MLLYKQLVDDAKIPLAAAQQEIDALKKDLIMSNRKENQLEKTAEKFEKEKDMQTNATLRAEQKMKEQTELVSKKDKATTYCPYTILSKVTDNIFPTLLPPGD